MLVRAYVGMIGTGAVERVFWYDFKDDGLKRDYNEANFGIVRHETFNCAPKPAYVAYAVMSRVLTGSRFARREELGPGAVGYRFERPDGSAVLVAWAPEEPCAVTVPGGARGVTDLMGNPVEAEEAEGGLRLALTGDPIYVEVAAGRG